MWSEALVGAREFASWHTPALASLVRITLATPGGGGEDGRRAEGGSQADARADGGVAEGVPRSGEGEGRIEEARRARLLLRWNGGAAFKDDLRRAGAEWTLVEFGGAVHSFTDKHANRHGRAMYDPKVAARAYEMMRDFFAEKFGAGK